VKARRLCCGPLKVVLQQLALISISSGIQQWPGSGWDQQVPLLPRQPRDSNDTCELVRSEFMINQPASIFSGLFLCMLRENSCHNVRCCAVLLEGCCSALRYALHAHQEITVLRKSVRCLASCFPLFWLTLVPTVPRTDKAVHIIVVGVSAYTRYALPPPGASSARGWMVSKIAKHA
jgi:hypothetical protein